MAQSRPIRVLIVDDHKVVRNGLRAFLMTYDDIELIGEARNGEEAIRICATTPPDVVLMDLVMPKMDGAEATRIILEENPDIRVIALTSFPEADLVEKTLKAGAISYLLKDVEDEELGPRDPLRDGRQAGALPGGDPGLDPCYDHRRA